MGRRMLIRAVAVAVPAVVALGAAGCGGEPEPRFAPPAEPSPSASATASPSESATGEPAKPLSREETVRAWVEARNAALQDGDTSAVRDLYAPGCEGCAAFVDPIDSAYDDGGYFKTPGWTVQKTLIVEPSVVDMRARAAAGTSRGSSADKPVTFPEAIRDLRFGVRKNAGRWLITSIGVLQR